MKDAASRLFAGVGYLLIVLVLSGCASVAFSASTLVATGSQPIAAPVSGERAGAIALNALESWNTGDYGEWSEHWSPSLKAAVRPADFEAFHNRYSERYGRCFAITHSESGASARAGFVRWIFDVQCEAGRLRFTFAFADGSEQLEAVYVEPLK